MGDIPSHSSLIAPAPGYFLEEVLGARPLIDAIRTMNDVKRTAVQVWIKLAWQRAREDYADAGEPFGEGRGLEIWIEYGELTTVN